jgi:hypothetical protein
LRRTIDRNRSAACCRSRSKQALGKKCSAAQAFTAVSTSADALEIKSAHRRI